MIGWLVIERRMGEREGKGRKGGIYLSVHRYLIHLLTYLLPYYAVYR